ncbi:DUF1361 domain-containing protein [Parafilimonas sp.]|uniref:DUF1361 domain-containing protein n=1 Tax=Parafilimonas sp. TaxID=1969739 RepID=UPI003F807BF3
MKLKKLSDTKKLVLISLGFTLSLLFARAFYTGELAYFFYPWNLFLATVPLFFSSLLKRQATINYKSIFYFILWLLFLPNAPYLVTDIFHFEHRSPVPIWFDLMLVVSGAWNGILLCMLSLFSVEKFIRKVCNKKYVNGIMLSILVACGYGIYIGRFLRFNSWDVVTDPTALLKASTHHLHHPVQSINVWLFTFLFASFLSIVYFTIKKLPQALPPRQF